MSNINSSGTISSKSLNWATIAIMLTGGLISALALFGITAVLPQIEADLAQTDTDKMLIKLLATIVGLSMVIGAPLGGYLADRLGLRKVLIGGSISYALFGTAGLYLDSLSAIFASRLLLGFTAAAVSTLSMVLINTRLYGVERAKWMGYHIGATLAGSIVLLPTVGLLGELGWRWPFALYSLGLVVAAVAFFGMTNDTPQTKLTAAHTPKDSLFNWFPMGYAVLAILIGMVTYVPMVYVPFLLRETGITSPTAISMLLLADSVIGAVVATQFGRSQKFLTSQGAFIYSFLCTGIGLLIASLAASSHLVVTGMIVFGFGTGWFMANLMTSVSRQISEDKQGRAAGVVKGAHYLAAPLGTVLVEPFARMFGPSGATAWVSAICFICLAYFIYKTTTGKSSILVVQTSEGNV